MSAHLSRLTAGTTYHYRLVAQNAAGTTQGADQTFTTSAASAPTVTTGRAFGVRQRSALLSGAVKANGARTTYWFRYGATTTYGLQSKTHSVGSRPRNWRAFARLTGLTPGTTYHYQLVASNGSVTINGADQTFTTRQSNKHLHRRWRRH